jgi:hypothetical protein
VDAERGFDPDGKRVRDEGAVVGRGPAGRVGHAGGQFGPEGDVVSAAFWGDPPERLADDVLGQHAGAEQLPGHGGHLPLLFAGVVGTGQRGGRAYTLDPGGVEGVSHPPDQHGHVGPLPAAVGVQLVEDQELKAPGGLDDGPPLLGPRQQQFQHDVVGQEDVRWGLLDLLAFLERLLAGVAGEADGGPALRVAVAQELFQFAPLAVGQGVHGVDDDRLDALPAAAAEDVVHGRHDVGQRLAAARPGSEDVGQTRPGHANGLGLVAVEAEGVARGIGPRLTAEDAAALRVQLASGDQLVDRLPGLEGRVQLDQRLGPQHPFVELTVDEVVKPGLVDVNEATGVAGVVVNEPAAEVEDVHGKRLAHAWCLPKQNPSYTHRGNPKHPEHRPSRSRPSHPEDLACLLPAVEVGAPGLGRLLGHPELARGEDPLHIEDAEFDQPRGVQPGRPRADLGCLGRLGVGQPAVGLSLEHKHQPHLMRRDPVGRQGHEALLLAMLCRVVP